MFFFLFGRSIITLDLCSSFNDDYEFAYSKESSDVVRCSNAAMRYELDTTLQIHFFFLLHYAMIYSFLAPDSGILALNGKIATRKQIGG